MPEYAHVTGSTIDEVGLPTVGELADGRTVSNYHLLDEATLTAEGWRPVVEEPATWDPHQQVTGTSYRVEADRVVRVLELGWVPAELNADRLLIPADGTTPALVSLVDYDPARTSPVTFTVNGTAATADLVNGIASLEVVATTPGLVDVTVGDLAVLITAE